MTWSDLSDRRSGDQTLHQYYMLPPRHGHQPTLTQVCPPLTHQQADTRRGILYEGHCAASAAQTLVYPNGDVYVGQVAAAVGAISLTVVMQYWLPILVISVIGGVVIFITVVWLASRIFSDYQFHRALIVYGACTGTMPTGLALLRVVDPDFETPVATDYMYSSAITFFLVIPFILAINLPAYSYTENNPMYFWAAIGVAAAYLLFGIISNRVVAKKRAFAKFTTLWYEE